METQNIDKRGFFKKYWQIILICVLGLFGMSKCTTSCNRQSTIDSQVHYIDSITACNDSLRESLNYYTAMYELESKHNDNFTNIAVGNQNELYAKITALEKDNESLVAKSNALAKENKDLKSKINELIKQTNQQNKE